MHALAVAVQLLAICPAWKCLLHLGFLHYMSWRYLLWPVPAGPVGPPLFRDSQCGGNQGNCALYAACADAPYPGYTCPVGLACIRQLPDFWQCRNPTPSPAPGPGPGPVPSPGELSSGTLCAVMWTMHRLLTLQPLSSVALTVAQMFSVHPLMVASEMLRCQDQ